MPFQNVIRRPLRQAADGLLLLGGVGDNDQRHARCGPVHQVYGVHRLAQPQRQVQENHFRVNHLDGGQQCGDC